MANGLSVAERRGVLTATDAERCITNLERLLSLAIVTESTLVVSRTTFTVARDFGLSATMLCVST
jgi:hypothetical protein